MGGSVSGGVLPPVLTFPSSATSSTVNRGASGRVSSTSSSGILSPSLSSSSSSSSSSSHMPGIPLNEQLSIDEAVKVLRSTLPRTEKDRRAGPTTVIAPEAEEQHREMEQEEQDEIGEVIEEQMEEEEEEVVLDGTEQEIKIRHAIHILSTFTRRGSSYDVAIGKSGAIEPLLYLCSKSSRLLSPVIELLAGISAEEPNKPELVLNGCVVVISDLLRKQLSNLIEGVRLDSILRILQNVSESKFDSGAANPLLYRIVQEGAARLLIQVAQLKENASDFITQCYLACLTLCNLSMHPQNHQHLQELGVFDTLSRFISNTWGRDIDPTWLGWRTLQPIVPLLLSHNDPVCLFGALSVRDLSRYSRTSLLWRSIAQNGGIQVLESLTKRDNIEIRKIGHEILTNLAALNPSSHYVVPVPFPSLPADLGVIFDKPEFFTDTIIIPEPAPGEVEKVIQVHKAILAARSPVFAAMHSHRWRVFSGREGENSEFEGKLIIRVPGFDYDTMKTVLWFVYTDRAEIDWNNAVNVLQAAGMYSIDRLFSLCEEILIQAITPDTILNLLSLSETHAAPHLKTACLHFLQTIPLQSSSDFHLQLHEFLVNHPHLYPFLTSLLHNDE